MNIDIAPTVLELAGAEADKSIDGRSMVPYLQDPELRSRRPLLFESFVETNDVEQQGAIDQPGDQSGGEATGASAGTRREPRRRGQRGRDASLLAPPKDYEGIRLGPYKYIAWPDGEKELYDINRDPNELNNIAKVPNFFPIRNFLHEELRRLEDCVGRECSEPAAETAADPQGIPAPAQARKTGKTRRTQGTEGKTRRRTAAPPLGRRSSARGRAAGRYLITASTSPLETESPSETFSSSTLPERWAAISFSIFIASITQIRSPSETSAPFSTATLKTVPCSGEGSASLEALGPPPDLRSRLGGRLRAAAGGRRERRPPPRRSP